MEPSARTTSAFKIPILVPLVPLASKIHIYISKIDSNKFYSNFGPLERELRERFAEIWSVPATNIRTACNATLALQGAIETSEPNSSPWETPSWTFAATALALEKAGVNYDFVDVSLVDWRAVFSRRVKNVVDVLPFGDELAFERFDDLPIENLVIDGAASIATLMTTLPKISKTFALVISLHATKLLPAGEGAIFVTNSRSWAERFGIWTNFGFGPSRHVGMLGTNAKLSEYSAAVAHAALDDFPQTLSKIRYSQSNAIDICESIGLTVHPAMRKKLPSPYWIVDLGSQDKKEMFRDSLELSGVETRDWWGSGCHTNPIFRPKSKNLPNASTVASQTLGLPMHTFLTSQDFSYLNEVLFSLERKLS